MKWESRQMETKTELHWIHTSASQLWKSQNSMHRLAALELSPGTLLVQGTLCYLTGLATRSWV